MAAKRSNVLMVAVGLALALWWWIRSRAARAAAAAAAALRRDQGFPPIGALGVSPVELASDTPEGSFLLTFDTAGKADGPDGEIGPVPNFTWAELKTVRPNAIAERDKFERYVRLAYRLQLARLTLGAPMSITQVIDYPERGYAVARFQVSGKYSDDKSRTPLQKLKDFLNSTSTVKGKKGPFSVAQPTGDDMSLWIGPFNTELP